jgi:hypothetical protein
MNTPYWARLAKDDKQVQRQLDAALVNFRVEPVGHGYIDIIVPRAKAEAFLEEMSRLGIASHCATMWCEATAENKEALGCPHGMGGPVNYGIWYSEMCETHPFDVEDRGFDIMKSRLEPFALARTCNAIVLSYIQEGMRKRLEWSPCLVPGIWLAVPDDWRSPNPPSA